MYLRPAEVIELPDRSVDNLGQLTFGSHNIHKIFIGSLPVRLSNLSVLLPLYPKKVTKSQWEK